ncbi:hypothetical protein CN345_29275 [Bacillus thuringiensis]|uniref:hypothetical protein n=1 Tax=Bacillus thuringiensis TaxID=1428 RepID=UPI000BF8C4D5|nr:hypothetical protein [Bacillus thuringiensis]PES11214.1 hypothetical protein CN488_29375 [Bacillus anthracis]PEZ21582.1 hypothetical protein CN345_29275 [Bacillus thuringiensis]PGY59684.1 hypothetical protein COE09_08805 [Bacillus thuringiensis]
MKLRKKKSIVIPVILACCSFMIADFCSAAVVPPGENTIESSKYVGDGLPNQPGDFTVYQYTGSEWLDITQVFQKRMLSIFD